MSQSKTRGQPAGLFAARAALLRLLSVLIGAAALAAAVAGLAVPEIYRAIIPLPKLPFVFAQDCITVAAAAALLALSLFRFADSERLDVIRIGLVGYLFYAYGLAVMGVVYNDCYFIYLAVFGLSIFYFIFAFGAVDLKKLEIRLPGPLRIAIALFCAAVAVFFAPQWILAILGAIRDNLRPDTTGFAFNYYVYILDLCFVLPVCVITSVMLFRNHAMGTLLGGVITIKGFTLMLSVAVGFMCQPAFHQPPAVPQSVLFSVIALACLALGAAYFLSAKIVKLGRNRGPA
jgi:hypothetical protein